MPSRCSDLIGMSREGPGRTAEYLHQRILHQKGVHQSCQPQPQSQGKQWRSKGGSSIKAKVAKTLKASLPPPEKLQRTPRKPVPPKKGCRRFICGIRHSAAISTSGSPLTGRGSTWERRSGG